MNKVLFESYLDYYKYEIGQGFYKELLLSLKNNISLIETIEFEHKLSVFRTDEIIRNIFNNYDLTLEQKIYFLKQLKSYYFNGISNMVKNIENDTDAFLLENDIFIQINENIKNIFTKPIELIEEELNILDKKNTPINVVIPQIKLVNKGFYIKSPAKRDYLKDIYNSLIELNYIDNKTKLKDFKKLFNNSDVSEITPVNWLGSLALLKHLIKLLNIDLPAKGKNNKMIISFTHKGKVITPKQLKDNKPTITKDTKKLDNIFKSYPNT
jgi:hypothetical protein